MKSVKLNLLQVFEMFQPETRINVVKKEDGVNKTFYDGEMCGFPFGLFELLNSNVSVMSVDRDEEYHIYPTLYIHLDD